MSKQHYQTLFAYSWQTAQKLLDKAALLSASDLHADPGYGHGSIHDLFFHLLSVSYGWRVTLETKQQPRRLDADGFESLLTVGAALSQEYERWQALLAALRDEDVDASVMVTTVRGASASLDYWRTLQHLVLHAMQHHTEIAALLTRYGQSPGDLDFIFYEA